MNSLLLNFLLGDDISPLLLKSCPGKFYPIELRRIDPIEDDFNTFTVALEVLLHLRPEMN